MKKTELAGFLCIIVPYYLFVLSRLLNPLTEEIIMKIERNRAYRRWQNHLNKGKGQGSKKIDKPEKRWKCMYFRSNKLIRAQQLGFEYPRRKLIDVVYQDYDCDE